MASPSIMHERTGHASIASAIQREAVGKVDAIARKDPEAVVLTLRKM
jgi:hypothetical protein